MTNTTYKVGDKVRILDASRIMFGSSYFSDGDITTVVKFHREDVPCLKTKPGDDCGLVIMSHELPFIEKVEEVVQLNHPYQLGDKVRILSASSIMCGLSYFKNGDITTIVETNYNRNPRVARFGGDAHGLLITKSELRHIEKVEDEAPELDAIAAGFKRHGLKVGDKVRVLNARGIMAGWSLSNGMITEVIEMSLNGNPLIKTHEGDTHGLVIMRDEYACIERVYSGPAPIPGKRAPVDANPDYRISTLESQVASLEAKVKALETGNVDVMTPEAPSANAARAALIEHAKAYVGSVTHRMISGRINHEGNSTFQHRTTKPYFTTKGRTVTVVAKGTNLPTEYERASATAAPGDVFNEYIGQAIALGRAMGLNVPAEFTKAPQPTKVVVGMEVDTLYFDGSGKNPYCPTKVTDVRSDGKPGFGNGSRSTLYEITDDTNAQYKSSESEAK